MLRAWQWLREALWLWPIFILFDLALISHLLGGIAGAASLVAVVIFALGIVVGGSRPRPVTGPRALPETNGVSEPNPDVGNVDGEIEDDEDDEDEDDEDDEKEVEHEVGTQRRDGLDRTVLRGANLAGATLRSVDLRDADLRDADLSGADLSGADLRGADLTGAHLGPSEQTVRPR